MNARSARRLRQRKHLVGIDIGSSSCRAHLFDLSGHSIRNAVDSASSWPRADGELDADAVYGSVLRVLREVSVETPTVAGIAVTAQVGLVTLDRSGTALKGVVTWRDSRARFEAADLRGEFTASGLARIAGRHPSADSAAAFLPWLKRNQPERLAATRSLLTLKDYVVFRLTGQIATDPAHASFSGLFNINERTWSQAILSALGLDSAILPTIRESTDVSGGLTASIAGQLGIAAGTPVATGGPDGSVGALGAGVDRPGAAVDVTGTTDAAYVAVDQPVVPTAGVVSNAFVLPNVWVLGGPTGMTGGAIAWLSDLLKTDVDTLFAAATPVPPGARGLRANCELTGSRTPDWDADASGYLVGLREQHGPAEIARALLESAAFRVADIFDIVEAGGAPIDSIRVAGGLARHPLPVQIRADVFGRAIAVPEDVEASALGAALLAGLATGEYSNARHATQQAVRIGRTVVPGEPLAQYRAVRSAQRNLDGAIRNAPRE